MEDYPLLAERDERSSTGKRRGLSVGASGVVALFKNRWVQLVLAVLLGSLVMLIPRPEGKRFEITGDPDQKVYSLVSDDFSLVTAEKSKRGYLLELKTSSGIPVVVAHLKKTVEGINGAAMNYVDGLPPKAQRFLAVLVLLVFLFIFEPIPLEITAILIAVLLVVTGIFNVKDAWASYMNPVVPFIMCCLIFAIALEKVGLTRRLGQMIIRKAGGSVTKFTFFVAIGLGVASSVMHDAAATAIGIAMILPLMRGAGIEPNTNTARFMMLSIPFACSCGGMGTLVGGGRCMVAAAFLKELTGIEISFLDWMIMAMPAALITIPVAVFMLYLIYRPDPSFTLPHVEAARIPWASREKYSLIILGIVFLLWLTKGIHGIDYSITGMLGVGALVLFKILEWEDIHNNLEWGTALFIFGGGLALGLAMDASGAARYFAGLFFPLVDGRGWLILFIGVGVFGAFITNVMANVAAAALILPIVIPLAQLEGVDPRVLALCLGMSTSFAMLLVIGCPPNAIAYSFGQFKSLDLSKAGLVAMPVLLLFLVVVAMVWWNIIGLV